MLCFFFFLVLSLSVLFTPKLFLAFWYFFSLLVFPFFISLVSECSLSSLLYIYIYMDEVPVFLLLHVHSNLSCFSVFGSIIFSHLQILLCRMHVFFLLAPLLPSLSFWLLSLVSLCLQPSLDRRG